MTGVTTVSYNVPALEPGTYYFLCKVHPNMNGTLTAVTEPAHRWRARRQWRAQCRAGPVAGALTKRVVVSVVAVVAALAVISAVLAFSGLLGRQTPSASVIVVSRDPLVGNPAPDFTLQTIDGQTVTLSALRGKPVIVNFWASWCIPCREEFPLLVGAYQQYSEQGLQIVGVIHDDGPQTATDFAKQYGATWPLVLDPNEAGLERLPRLARAGQLLHRP